MEKDRLFQNAIDCIEIGVEDFQLSTHDCRRLSSSVRNLTAGLLLLFKCILKKDSPDGSNGILIYQDFKAIKDPKGNLIFQPRGEKTVNSYEIEKRLRDLNYQFDWEKVEKISKIRNAMEHKFHDQSKGSAEEAFAEALPLIIQIVDTCLGMNSTKIFNDQCWEFLEGNKNVFKEKISICHDTFSSIMDETEGFKEILIHLMCKNCSSPYLKQVDPANDNFDEIKLHCDQCDENYELSELVKASVFIEEYLAQTNGGEPDFFLSECPECNKSSYSEATGECLSNTCRSAPTCRVCGAFLENNNPFNLEDECHECREEIQ